MYTVYVPMLRWFTHLYHVYEPKRNIKSHPHKHMFGDLDHPSPKGTTKKSPNQWLFLVPVKGGIGGIVHPPIGRKNVTYSPCLLEGYICYRSHLLREPHPKWWFSKGNPLISGKFRLVKYYFIWPGLSLHSYSFRMGLEPEPETTKNPPRPRSCKQMLCSSSTVKGA